MSNELLLVLNLIVVYAMCLASYYLFGKKGLLCWNAIATVIANIEVMILIKAFGIEQTLGNILFASTFITTDILSENYGKKEASLAVKTGIFASIVFIIITNFWLVFTPSENDLVMTSVKSLFSQTPRIMLSGFVVYAIVQFFDVWMYHKIWDITINKTGKKDKLLWMRNNVATMFSQLINAVLFNVFAFYGAYETKVLVEIIISTYLIYFITSLCDTPIVYLARKLKNKKNYGILYK